MISKIKECFNELARQAAVLKPQLIPRSATIRLNQIYHLQRIDRNNNSCEICGSDIDTRLSREPANNGLSPIIQLDIDDKVIEVEKLVTCCKQCQICLDFSSLFQLMIGQSHTRHEILWHMMGVNKVQKEIIENENEAARWMHTLLALCQSINVFVNSIGNWHIQEAKGKELVQQVLASPTSTRQAHENGVKERAARDLKEMPLILTQKGIKRRRLFQ